MESQESSFQNDKNTNFLMLIKMFDECGFFCFRDQSGFNINAFFKDPVTNGVMSLEVDFKHERLQIINGDRESFVRHIKEVFDKNPEMRLYKPSPPSTPETSPNS